SVQVGAPDHAHTEVREPLACFVHGGAAIAARHADAAAGILDHYHFVAKPRCVLGRPGNAEIRRQTRQEDTAKAALPQPSVEASRLASVVFEERRVAVYVAMEPLANDDLLSRQVELAMQCGISASLDSVIRPKHLLAVRHADRVVRLVPRMRA